MNSFLGFGREHVERHYRKTGQSVYMHLKRHVKEVSGQQVLFLVGLQIDYYNDILYTTIQNVRVRCFFVI